MRSCSALLKRVAVEGLEGRRLLAFSPTPFEQYMVELINRARADPVAEAQRYLNYKDNRDNVFNGDLNEGLPVGTLTGQARQPLAINPLITAAARQHSQWMVDTDTFSHTGAANSDPGQRIAAAGYSAGTWGENIAVNWSSIALNERDTVFRQHRDLFTDMPIAGRGHRTNMLKADFREIGVGLAGGPWVYPPYGTINALTSTHDFAANSSVFLTGVAYADTTLADSFYTPGEGLAGVTIIAKPVGGGTAVSTTTWTSGGYSLALTPGTYRVQATGGGLATSVFYNNVSVGTLNVKRDFVSGQAGDGDPDPSEPTPPADATAEIVGRTLVITGTDAPDFISVRRYGSTLRVLGSVTAQFRNADVDLIAITGNAGNDLLRNDTGKPAYIDGGYGKDTLIGGPSSDSLYGSAQPDLIYGNGGNDVLVGGNGHDLIYGGEGDDRIYGQAGNDTIDAGAGNDRIYGGDGDDFIAGGVGRDILYGEIGADTLHGGPHRDYADNDPLDTRIAIEVLA